MDKTTITQIFKRFKAANSHPTTELVYHTPFELLLAVILSAQATDKSVNKATHVLFKVANTPQGILELGEHKLKQHIQSIGLYQSKAKHIMATCRLLLDQFHGHVPENRNDLETLPGVGRKTANVLLNTLFNQPTIAVDTHIFRVANRIGLAKGSTPLNVEKQLLLNIPKAYLHDAHHWLILHGRYVCTARNPKCLRCPIQDLCEYPDKTTLDS